jgi:hypothetical protein
MREIVYLCTLNFNIFFIMKKSAKIALWVLGSLIVLLVGLFLSADIIASKLVRAEVHRTFEKMPDVDANVGEIYLNLISGSAIVKDITFSSRSLTLDIPTIAIWNINYIRLFRHRRIEIFKVDIDDPQVMVCLDEKNPSSILPDIPKDTTLEKAGFWLRDIHVRHVDIDRFSARLYSTSSPLIVSADSLSVEAHDLAYNFTDSLFTYNDSVYSLSLAAAKIALPDGLTEMEIHSLVTEDQGPLALGYTRIHNIVTPKQLADMAKEPVSWIDLELNTLTTSAINPIRKALAKDYTLDSIRVDVKRMHVFRDERHKPKHPFITPQEFLKPLPVLFCIKKVETLARKIDIELATTDKNCGKMHLKNIHVWLSNVTNRPGAIWHNFAKAPFGKKGHVEATYDLHMDKTSSFAISLKAENLELEEMNPFIRPLVGITCSIHLNQLDATYSGDGVKAAGAFCMQYHGLKVKVHKEDDIPYKIVTKHADFFTSAANSLIPKSNPTIVDIRPRKYSVEWTRDEWSPYPLYLFGPCIDGIKKTMLPGLYVHKQI